MCMIRMYVEIELRMTVFLSLSLTCFTEETSTAWRRSARKVQPPLAALPPESVFAISTFAVMPIYAALLSPMKKLVRKRQKKQSLLLLKSSLRAASQSRHFAHRLSCWSNPL